MPRLRASVDGSQVGVEQEPVAKVLLLEAAGRPVWHAESGPHKGDADCGSSGLALGLGLDGAQAVGLAAAAHAAHKPAAAQPAAGAALAASASAVPPWGSAASATRAAATRTSAALAAALPPFGSAASAAAGAAAVSTALSAAAHAALAPATTRAAALRRRRVLRVRHSRRGGARVQHRGLQRVHGVGHGRGRNR